MSLISLDRRTHRLCSVIISGLRGSRNILGRDRIPPDCKPTVWGKTLMSEIPYLEIKSKCWSTTALTLTEQVAAGDALLSQCGLHRCNGWWENVGLLQHLRSVGSVQGAEHCAVVELRSLVQFNHRELVPAWLGAPVFVLQNQTAARVTLSSVIQTTEYWIRPMILTTTQFSECTTCTGPLAFLWTASWMMRPVTPSIRIIPTKLRSWWRSVLSVTTARRLGFRYCKNIKSSKFDSENVIKHICIKKGWKCWFMGHLMLVTIHSDSATVSLCPQATTLL